MSPVGVMSPLTLQREKHSTLSNMAQDSSHNTPINLEPIIAGPLK